MSCRSPAPSMVDTVPMIESGLHSVGAMSRACGLPVSALRFYADNGVLVPAYVDPRTGYRWYSPDQVPAGRLLQAFRAASVPLAEIRPLVAAGCDHERAHQVLDAYLARKEIQLGDIRQAIAQARSLIGDSPQAVPSRAATRLRMTGPDLARAFSAIRFAVAVSGEMPALRGILVEARGGVLTLAATDRHRLAIARVAAAGVTGPPLSVVVPPRILDRSAAQPLVSVEIDASGWSSRTEGRHVGFAAALDGDFPDYRRLLPQSSRHRVSTDVRALHREVAAMPSRRVKRGRAGEVRQVSTLAVRRDGTLAVEDPRVPDRRAVLRIGVDRRFFLQALEALGCDRLTLDMDSPVKPLTLRPGHSRWPLSVLMPFRL